MSTERILVAAILTAALFGLSRLGPGALNAWRTYSGTSQRRQQDVTGIAPLPSPAVAGGLEELSGVGYESIGQSRIDLSSGPHYGWIAAARDGDSYAIVTPTTTATGLFAGLYSLWPDGMWLETTYPIGEHIDRPGHRTDVVATSLSDAAAAHRSAVASLAAEHGRPRPFGTMRDLLAFDADYRTRLGGRVLRRRTIELMLPAAVALIVASVALVALALVSR